MSFFDPGGGQDASGSESLQLAYVNGGGGLTLNSTNGALALTDAASTIGAMFTGTNSASTLIWSFGNSAFLFATDAATNGSQLKNSPTLTLRGKYWNGAASVDTDSTFQVVVWQTTSPQSYLAVNKAYVPTTDNDATNGRLGIDPINVTGAAYLRWRSISIGSSVQCIGDVATSGATTKNSASLQFRSQYWDGSATQNLQTLIRANQNSAAATDFSCIFSMAGSTIFSVNRVDQSVTGGTTDTQLLGNASVVWKAAYLGAGTVALPSLAVGEATTGVYASGSHLLSISINNNKVLDFSQTAAGSVLMTAPTQFKATAASGIGFLRIDDSSGLLLQYDNTYMQVGSVTAKFNISSSDILSLDVPSTDNDTSMTLNWKKAGVQTQQRVQLLALASIVGQKVLVVTG